MLILDYITVSNNSLRNCHFRNSDGQFAPKMNENHIQNGLQWVNDFVDHSWPWEITLLDSPLYHFLLVVCSNF